MRGFDVFNGDADGICALLQLRLDSPCDAELITGLKRNIGLLQQIDASQGDRVTVLDISLDKNRQALMNVLGAGAEVLYVDHHYAGDIPHHANLLALIETTANVCTSILVDRYLRQRFSAWAMVGAFGDNLDQPALLLARGLGLSESHIQKLRELGICINYNGYGGSIDDLHFHPGELYRQLSGFISPLDFMAERSEIHQKLLDGYRDDMAQAWEIAPHHLTGHSAVYLLPDAKWARRVSGVWSNALANRYPDRAHAVLNPHPEGGYLVSVRAPLNIKTAADELCMRFPGGGGRKAAAGINQLAEQQLGQFIDALDRQWSRMI